MTAAAPSPSVPALALPLVTRRLRIRDYAAGDAQTVYGYARDPAYWQFQRAAPPTAAQIDALIALVVNAQAVTPRLAYFLAATRSDTGEIVGEAVLKITDPAARQGELGFGVAPRFWRQGYATEAVAAVLDAAFQQLRLHRVSAQCAPENKGSVRVMQKAGMAREGLLRDVHYARGRWWSTLVYGMLDHEYAKIRAAQKG